MAGGATSEGLVTRAMGGVAERRTREVHGSTWEVRPRCLQCRLGRGSVVVQGRLSFYCMCCIKEARLAWGLEPNESDLKVRVLEMALGPSFF